jgi:hypothetical protein
MMVSPLPSELHDVFLCYMTGYDVDLAYQLDIQAKQLCRLCVTWRRNVCPLPGDKHDNTWGLSDEDLQDALVIEFNPSWLEEPEDDNGSYGDNEDLEDSDWQDVDEEFDSEFVESMEAVAFTDEYRTGETNHFSYMDSDMGQTLTTPSGSPRKHNQDFLLSCIMTL